MKVTANGINVNYTLDGPAGAPVVTLSHSLAADLTMWDPQLTALAATYRVLRYDTRGHGGTDAPAGPYTLEQLAEDAKALLGALGIARTHWIGLSMGGMIGQTLALSSPGLFLSLSLCDTSSRIPAEAKPIWQERIATAESQGMEPIVEPTIGRWFTAPFREARKDIAQLDLTDRIGAIKLPTLIVVGEEDQGTPVAASQAIQAQIAGSQLEIIKSASHLSNLEQPETFTRILTTFLGRVSAR
jgi:3-oxoadipate enol-lactonase